MEVLKILKVTENNEFLFDFPVMYLHHNATFTRGSTFLNVLNADS